MASVWCLPNLTVTVNEVDEYGVHHPVPSNQICAASATWTKHAIVVKRSTRFAIGLTFDLNAQPKSHIFIGDFVEVGLQFDGFRVAHRRIPVDEIVALGGRYVFDHFVDGGTGAVRVAEIRPIERAESEDEEEEDALLRAQRLGKIEVTVAHGKGTMIARGYDAASALPNNSTLPDDLLSRNNASHYIHYGMPNTPVQRWIAYQFANYTLAGEIGYFEFHYGSMEALYQADDRLQVDNAGSTHPFGPRNNGSVPAGARDAPDLVPGVYPQAKFSAYKPTKCASSLNYDNGNISVRASVPPVLLSMHSQCNLRGLNDPAKNPVSHVASPLNYHAVTGSNLSMDSIEYLDAVPTDHPTVQSSHTHSDWLYAPDVTHNVADYLCMQPATGRRQWTIVNDADFGHTGRPANHPLFRGTGTLLVGSRGLGYEDQ